MGHIFQVFMNISNEDLMLWAIFGNENKEKEYLAFTYNVIILIHSEFKTF